MAPYTMTARALGYLGNRLEEATLPMQEAAGAQAVTMDADGNVKVNRRWLEFSQGDRAYNHAASVAGLAMARTKVSTDLTQLRIQFDGRPDEFQKAADAYVRDIGKGGDRFLRPLIQREAGNVAGQLARGLMVDKERVDFQRFNNDLNAREQQLSDQLESLAEQSGVNTPEFLEKQQELVDLRAQRAGNPKFAYSPEQAAIDNGRTGEHLKALAIVGQYRRQYLETGDLAGTLKAAEERLNAEDLKLPPDQRAKYLGAITARTQAAAAVRQETIRQTTDQADLLITALNSEDRVDPRTVDDTITTLRQYRQYSKVAQLETARVVNEIAPILRSGTPVEKAAAMARLRGQAATGTTDREAYYRAIGAAESSGDPNARNPNSSATGLFQFTKGTWDQLREDHPELGLTADGRTDPEQQRRAIRIFTDENEARLRSIGAEPTAQNLYTAHFLGGAGAVRFIGGLRTNPNAPAANYVDPDAVDANRTIFFTDGGRGRARTAQEVYSLLGNKVGDASGSVGQGPVYAAAVKQLQTKFNAEVEAAWTKVKTAWDNGDQPTQDEIQNVVALAPLLSDPKMRKEIAERFEREELLERVDGQSVVAIRTAVDELDRAAEAGDLPPAGRALRDGLAKREEILTKKLQDDPLSLAGSGPLSGELGTGVRESIGPLRFDSVDTLRAQLQQRAIVARTVSNYHGQPLGSVLRPDDVPQVRQILQSGDGGTVSAFFSAIGGLDNDVLFATLADNKLAQTVEGLTKTTDYGKYTAAMSGMDQLLRRNPDLFVQTFGADAVAKVQGWQARLAWETPDEGAKRLGKLADGRTSKIVEEMRSEAREWAKKKGDDAAINDLGIDASARAAFLADYRQMIEDANIEAADPEAAHKAALTTLKTVWKESPTNGGRVMKHAPEQYYPAVDGSHEWMRQQVEETLITRLGLQPSRTGGKGGSVEMRPTTPAYTLVSTPETQADIAAKRPPRYQVVFTNPATGRLEAFDARFNIDKAMAPVRERQAEAMKQDRRNLRREQINQQVQDATTPGFEPIDPVTRLPQ
ncbi:transglycosylase SLT domain-containing protein [Microvirga sp. KLBC 81]|uniref:transglycosylase SLT domain-containing protein n=1 Tax=Microvirga sp. KLBC 81 TaxID=1862707 RepID=UPI001403CB7A|nr:transglycosylase SLT domain-containing protein [Microvirga sp. KLBC 81]